MKLLTEKARITEIHETLGAPKRGGLRYPYHVNPLNENLPAYQQVTFGRNTATLLATLPDLHKRIKDLTDAYDLKGKATRQEPFPAMDFRTFSGSQECLPSNAWVLAHRYDEYPEPAIDISVAGGPEVHLNGNYKPGKIKAFMADARKTRKEN